MVAEDWWRVIDGHISSTGPLHILVVDGHISQYAGALSSTLVAPHLCTGLIRNACD